METSDDDNNLFRPELLQIFNNVETLHIMTSLASTGMCIFSFVALLRLIKGSGLKTIVIKSVMYDGCKSWMETVWTQNSEKLVKLYKQEKYEVRWENHKKKVWFFIEKTK